MTILLADDQPIVRLGLQLHLASFLPQADCILCDSFAALLASLAQQPVELIVLDIGLPDTEYTRMVERIRAMVPQVRILIYSGLDENEFALAYLQAGAQGYLSKQAPFSELQTAVLEIINGGKYVSHNIQQVLLKQLSQHADSMLTDPFGQLSATERHLLQFILEGLGTTDIAQRMNLRASSVSTLKRRMFTKLRVSSLSELLQKVAVYKPR